MSLTYLEEVGDSSPNSAGFSVERGRAVSNYLLTGPAGLDLQNLPASILGGVSTEVGDGRLQRTPPLAHPVWPWLYASAIQNVVGLGYYDPDANVVAELTASNQEMEVPPLPQFWLYPWYRVTIEFSDRPFPIVQDTSIQISTSSWYYQGSPVTGTSSSLVTFPFANEWARYFDLDIDPKEQAVQAQQGTMKFQSTVTVVNSTIFPGQPRMTLPNKLLRMVWYQVPYRYYTSQNSYLDRWVGCINQNGITLAGKFYPAGSLLYLGCKPRKYSPPVPQLDQFQPGVFSLEKWCNLELSFLYTTRAAPVGDLPAAPPNRNFIMAGWNLFPWVVDRQYHFAMTQPATGVIPSPGFFSFPVEIMQYDPDAAGALQVGSYP